MQGWVQQVSPALPAVHTAAAARTRLCLHRLFQQLFSLMPPRTCSHSLGTAVLVAMAAALLGWTSWECREGRPPRSLYFHADKDQSFSLWLRSSSWLETESPFPRVGATLIRQSCTRCLGQAARGSLEQRESVPRPEGKALAKVIWITACVSPVDWPVGKVCLHYHCFSLFVTLYQCHHHCLHNYGSKKPCALTRMSL